MNQIIERAKAVVAGRDKVKAHPMCGNLSERPDSILITYPLGCHPSLDGLKVSTAKGRAWAFEQALERMERHWREGLV